MATWFGQMQGLFDPAHVNVATDLNDGNDGIVAHAVTYDGPRVKSHLFFLHSPVPDARILHIEDRLKTAIFIINADASWASTIVGPKWIWCKAPFVIRPIYSPVFLWMRTGFFRVTLVGKDNWVQALTIDHAVFLSQVFTLEPTDETLATVCPEPLYVNTAMVTGSIYETQQLYRGPVALHEKAPLGALGYAYNEQYKGYIR